jgi:tRNA 2-thiocytidine biosynthesis protein TtcA
MGGIEGCEAAHLAVVTSAHYHGAMLLKISDDGDGRPPVSGNPEQLRQRLSRGMLAAVGTYGLVEDGDRILVGVSGGKDSYTLLDLLAAARRKAPVDYELIAFHLDQGQPGYDGAPLRDWLEGTGIPFEIAREDTYTAVIAEAGEERDATYCRLCSRLRRGILYTAAERLSCNKVALGHHRDDSLETLLLNLFYAGRLQAMPARYTTNDGRFEVIRPLIECGEAEIAAHAEAAGYPILPCRLCGSQDDLKRVQVAELLATLERKIPNLRSVMLAALKNVRPSHLLDPEVAEAWLAQAGNYPPRR